MLSWIIFLLICFSAPNHGGTHCTIDAAHMGMRHHHVQHAKEAIVDTFKIDSMVIDCVDIYKQPVFQHPLLVNHTLQLKPNYQTSKINELVVTNASHLWNSSTSCPEGSIPIERITRHDQFIDNILNMPSHKHHKYFSPQRMLPTFEDNSVHEHSFIRAYGNHMYGGKATVNVWKPKVDKKSYFSLAQIWISTESSQDVLEAGWTVYPEYYGTAEPRFFVFRTPDNYSTGCYNLDCPGFVQTNHRTILSVFLRPVSVYGGQQYAVDIEIFKDKISGNWWVRLQGMDMGYWPKEIAPTLAEGGTTLDFGGEVDFDAPGPHPEMGSGHFSREGFKKASFFKNVQVIQGSSSYAYQTPTRFKAVAENKGCYDIEVGENIDGPWGLYFFFGGPGEPSETCG